MDKKEYIIRQLSKTNKKNYENYVITRIWSLLNDLDVKFICQQYVKRPKGCGLADMHFPQFNKLRNPPAKPVVHGNILRTKSVWTKV